MSVGATLREVVASRTHMAILEGLKVRRMKQLRCLYFAFYTFSVEARRWAGLNGDTVRVPQIYYKLEDFLCLLQVKIALRQGTTRASTLEY